MKIKSESIELVDINMPVPYDKNMHGERWKKIRDTNYVISTSGRLFNYKNNRFKKPTMDRHGYLTWCISSKGKKKTILAHRLIAKHFLSDYSENLVVNHIDYNRKNNCVENLEMCTVKQNARHSAKAGRYIRFGESNNNCKVSDDRVLTIWTYLEQGFSCVNVSKKMSLPRKYINDIKLGKIRNIWKI